MPEALLPLVNHGILDDVVRPLMSGKEAQVYLVIAEGRQCVAKVYKDAQHRSFKNKAEYTEGRRVRNTRDQRAMSKRTAYGRAQDEAAWKSTEVDMIYRLSDAGVRVPEPYWFVDGVLVMELVSGFEGNPAKRLAEVELTREDAQLVFEVLLADVVRMLHAGVVHGDLSEFNVLMAEDGPVIIDFPQAINAAGNQNARKILIRDVDNLHRFIARYVPEWTHPPYAEEMWALYERGELTPETELKGKFVRSSGPVNTAGVMDLIDSARQDEQDRRRRMGEPERGRGRRSSAPPREVQVTRRDTSPSASRQGPPGRPNSEAPSSRSNDGRAPGPQHTHRESGPQPSRRDDGPTRANRDSAGAQRSDHRDLRPRRDDYNARPPRRDDRRDEGLQRGNRNSSGLQSDHRDQGLQRGNRDSSGPQSDHRDQGPRRADYDSRPPRRDDGPQRANRDSSGPRQSDRNAHEPQRAYRDAPSARGGDREGSGRQQGDRRGPGSQRNDRRDQGPHRANRDGGNPQLNDRRGPNPQRTSREASQQGPRYGQGSPQPGRHGPPSQTGNDGGGPRDRHAPAKRR